MYLPNSNLPPFYPFITPSHVPPRPQFITLTLTVTLIVTQTLFDDQDFRELMGESQEILSAIEVRTRIGIARRMRRYMNTHE